MPELPEVEVTRQSLEQIFSKQAFVAEVKCRRKNLRYDLPINEFKKIKNQKVVSIERRAKYLKLSFANKQEFVFHLGMTGSFRFEKTSLSKFQKHDHVIFQMIDNTQLIYNDPRRFGFFLSWPGSWDKVTSENLGYEPFDQNLNAQVFFDMINKRQTSIKAILMDQKIIVGVGNIYASEVLYRAKIHPDTPGCAISLKSCSKILQQIRAVLQQAIENGGSTIRDFKTASNGKGSYQHSHQVYGREGAACFKCKTVIQTKKTAGRSTFWCPKCQKAKDQQK